MIQRVELAAWLLSLAVELALVVRAIYWRLAFRLPLFCLFLCYDLPRSFFMWLVRADPVYARYWRLTEVPSIALLAIAGLEAWARLARTRPPWWWYAGVAGGLLSVGFTVPRTPVPLATLLVCRTFAVACIAAGLASAIGARARCDLHAGLMLAFCAVDVIAHMTIVLGADRFYPESFLMIGQGAVLVCWLLLVRRLAATAAG